MALENASLVLVLPKDQRPRNLRNEPQETNKSREKEFINVCSGQALDGPDFLNVMARGSRAPGQVSWGHSWATRVRRWTPGPPADAPLDSGTLGAWPLHTRVGVPPRTLAWPPLALQSLWRSPRWLWDGRAAWCQVALLGSLRGQPLGPLLLGIPPLGAPERASLDVEGESRLMSMALGCDPGGSVLPRRV